MNADDAVPMFDLAKAARRLHVTPSAVSNAVARLRCKGACFCWDWAARWLIRCRSRMWAAR